MTPDEIARILDELGQRLGPSGEYVFGLAVRQAFIDGVIGVVVGGGGLLVLGLVAWRVTSFARNRWQEQTGTYKSARAAYDARRATDTRNWNYESEPREPDLMDVGFMLIFGGIAALFASGLLLSALVSTLPKLLNPEYAALTDILSRIVP